MNVETAEGKITAWLASQREAMVAALREMVDTDGGSYDKAGVDAVGAQVRRFLESHGVPVETIPRERYGDCLRATVAPAGGADGLASGNRRQNIVLMGHRDTVFPKGEPQRRPFRIEDGRAYGPGVIHSTAHRQKAWVIRVTGTDLDKLPRFRLRKQDRVLEKA